MLSFPIYQWQHLTRPNQSHQALLTVFDTLVSIYSFPNRAPSLIKSLLPLISVTAVEWIILNHSNSTAAIQLCDNQILPSTHYGLSEKKKSRGLGVVIKFLMMWPSKLLQLHLWSHPLNLWSRIQLHSQSPAPVVIYFPSIHFPPVISPALLHWRIF